MEAVNSSSETTGEAMRTCDGGVLCGSLAPVAYVPMQLFRFAVCSNCQTNCLKCQAQGDAVHPKNTSERQRNQQSESSSKEKNCTPDGPCDRARDNTGEIRCQCRCTSDGLDYGVSGFNALGFCGGGHIIEVKGRRNVMLCPKILPSFYANECSGKCRHHQKTDGTEDDGTPQQDEHTSEMNFKYGAFEGSTSSQTHRRLSSDSGRITWSDSGDSVFSDAQGVESSQSAKSVCGRKANLPTLLSQASLDKLAQATSPEMTASRSFSTKLHDITLSPQENLEDLIPPGLRRRKSEVSTMAAEKLLEDGSTANKVRGRPKRFEWQLSPPTLAASMPRRRAGRTESVPFLGDDEEEHYLTDMRRRRRLKTALETFQEASRRERIQSSSPEPRRSNSEWTIRRAGRMAHAGTTLGCLEEDDTSCISDDSSKQRRPRSRSLFVTANQSDMRLFRVGTTSPIRRNPPRSQQPMEINFSGQTYLIDAWEIGGDSPGKRSVKCYGLTAVPFLGGFALTDADKVKIKAYSLNGEMKVAFGTPTWPRYGRGITLTPDGKHIAVCHLSEVCIYALDGVCKDQIAHEEFTSCWGIALNSNGNYVITDPKSSSLFIMNQNGELIGRIGGNNRETRRQSKTRSSVGWRKSKSDKSLSGKKTKSNIQTANKNRRSSNPCTPQSRLVSESTGATSNGKKQARLLTPRYVAVNSKNQIIVTDTRQRCLMVLDEDGYLVYTIGGGRMGCQKCCSREHTRQDRKRGNMRRMESHSESEIWGSKSGCITRSETTDLAMRTTGKDEESSHQQSPIIRSPTTFSDVPDVRCSFSPSRSVGNRLSDHAERNASQFSSSLEEVSVLKSPVKDLEKSKSKFRQIVKRLRKPGWFTKRHCNKSNGSPSFHVTKHDSLTSLSVFKDSSEPAIPQRHSQLFDDISLSVSPASSRPDSKTTIFMFPSAEDRGEPSPRDDSGFSAGPFDLQSVELLDNDVTGYESGRETGGEPSSDDEDRRACRSCHVEDPRGVCVDRYDNILLADRARDRISVFNSNGHFVRHLITGADGLNAPMSVCILYDGCLAVTDSSSSIKIYRFHQHF